MARYAFACHLHTTADDGFLCPNWETHRSFATSRGRDARGASADGLARPCRQTLGFVSREPAVELGYGRTFINVKVVVVGPAETQDAIFQGARIASPSCVRTVRGGPIVNLQQVGADGSVVFAVATVRIVGDRPQRSCPEVAGRSRFWRKDGRCGRCGRLRAPHFLASAL